MLYINGLPHVEGSRYIIGDFLPSVDNTYDLGSAALSWNELHVQTAIYATSVVGNWSPSAASTYSLGTAALEWQGLFLGDDTGAWFGLDQDGVVYHRSAVLNADTALTGVLIGTPDTPALAANSIILANATADGDILIAGNDGGHSRTALFFDSSANTTYLGWSGSGGLLTLTTTAMTPSVNLVIGTSVVDEDSGAVVLYDMSVSATPADGVEESFAFNIDGNTILKLYSEADSAGAVDTLSIICGTHLELHKTDTDGTREGQIWYDASEDKLKFKTAAGTETITSA